MIAALEQNRRSLTYLALIDCDMDPKRALTLQLILQGDLIRLKHINLNKNPLLKERGVNSIINLANSFAATEVSMLQFAECGLDAQAAIRISRHLAQPENQVGRNLKLLNLAGNKIGDLGMEILLPYIENNYNLAYLDVSNNAIGDRGLLAIAGIIHKNTSL